MNSERGRPSRVDGGIAETGRKESEKGSLRRRGRGCAFHIYSCWQSFDLRREQRRDRGDTSKWRALCGRLKMPALGEMEHVMR